MVDALSRKLKVATLKHIAQLSRSVVEKMLEGRIREELLKDPQAMALKILVDSGKTRQFWVEEDLIIARGNRIYVPKVEGLKSLLLKECHDTLWAGQPRWQRTLALLTQGYFWPQMSNDVKEYTKSYLVDYGRVFLLILLQDS